MSEEFGYMMTLTLTYYLLMRMTIWIFVYLNTKFLNINFTGLTYIKSLTTDKTNIYLQFSDFTTGECANLYLGTVFGNPEDLCVCGQFVTGRNSLQKKIPDDFINLKWDTIVLSLQDFQFLVGKSLRSKECLKAAILTLELWLTAQTP